MTSKIILFNSFLIGVNFMITIYVVILHVVIVIHNPVTVAFTRVFFGVECPACIRSTVKDTIHVSRHTTARPTPRVLGHLADL